MLLLSRFSRVRLCATPYTAAHQAPPSLEFSRQEHWCGLPFPSPTHESEKWKCTISQIGLKLMSTELVMSCNHLILSCPLLLLLSIFPSFRVFSNELTLHIRWPKDWSFSFSISLSNEQSGLISFRIDWFDFLQSKRFSRVFSSTTIQKH